MKFGALGSIIGHEITHAFDQKGMHYDSKGLQNDLWSSEDAESVKNEQNCLINQYNGFGHQNFNVIILLLFKLWNMIMNFRDLPEFAVNLWLIFIIITYTRLTERWP